MRVPGFRKGKVPVALVIQRLGRETVLDEALRGALGRWYADAIDEAGIAPVGEPELDVGELPDEGEPLSFSIEIGVRPRATLGQYRDLEVGKREPVVEDRPSMARSSGCASASPRSRRSSGRRRRATIWWSTTSGVSTASPSRAAPVAISFSSLAPVA